MGLIKFDPSWQEQAAKSSRKLWSLRELAQWADIQKLNTTYKWAERLAHSKKLLRIAKGYYALPHLSPTSFEIASTIYAPSYISLESALAYHGILSQAPTLITSVTPKKSRRLRAQDMTYEYAHIPPAWFQGFDVQENTAMADPEKALIDCWYLRRSPHIKDLDLTRLHRRRLETWVAEFRHPRLLKIWKAWPNH